MTRFFPLPSIGKERAVRRFLVWLFLPIVLLTAKNSFAFPQIISQPASVYLSTGDTAVFSITVTQVTGVFQPVSIEWRRNGANIPGTLAVFSNTPATSFLTISNVQAFDAGVYHAVAFDDDGAINSTNVILELTNLTVLPVSNVFTNRGAIQDSFGGSGVASNFGFTNEPGTPNNGGIPGGAMVWLKWTAPATGVATFDTRGSAFDTTLGIYVIKTNGVEAVTNLASISGDDDEGGYFNSAVRFNAASGIEYEVGIDGYYGDRGNIVLNWSMETTGNRFPVITQQPISETVVSNATVNLSVTVKPDAGNSPPQYQWLFNDEPISGATDSAYSLSALPSTVGQYRVQVAFTNEPAEFVITSKPAVIQINLEGNTRAAAQAKLHQAADPNSYPGGPVPLAVPVSGFTGTQIYNTYKSAEEPGEPLHCNESGGSPYWFSCQPTNTGILTVDANSPTFTNVLAVYTWPGGIDYSNLHSVTCASTNAGDGHEVVVFPATNGVTYYLVVDGLNSGYGQVALTLSFVVPPLITTNPQSQTVTAGNNVTLNVAAIALPSPWYQWRTNAMDYNGQTNTTLTVTNFQAPNQIEYDVVVTNAVGTATSSPAMLYLDSPLRFTNVAFVPTNSFYSLLLGRAKTNYIVQASTNLATTNWIPILTNTPPYGLIYFTDTNVSAYSNRFFRAVVKTN